MGGMARSRLHELSENGVSVWVDSLSREMLETGHLARLIEKDAVVGVTSNPTIFEKALSTGDWYDKQLRAELERSDDTKEVFFALAVEDIKRACDLLLPVWERTGGVDGFVSIEVDPDLGLRAAGHLRAGERSCTGSSIGERVRQDPRHRARASVRSRTRSLPAARSTSLSSSRSTATRPSPRRTCEGSSVSSRTGGDPTNVASVASFFVSRVDTEADRRLAEIGREDLQGRLAVDNAKLAYEQYRRDLLGAALGCPRRRRCAPSALPVGVDLDEEPGVPRRPLRRGAHRPGDGEHDAVRDDRRLPGPRCRRAGTLTEGVDEAHALLRDLRIRRDRLRRRHATLESEGVQKFSDSFATLLVGIDAKRAAASSDRRAGPPASGAFVSRYICNSHILLSVHRRRHRTRSRRRLPAGVGGAGAGRALRRACAPATRLRQVRPTGTSSSRRCRSSSATDRVDVGNVYRALRAFEDEGLVDSEWKADLPGPTKRTYTLTPAGHAVLGAWLDSLGELRDGLTTFLDDARTKGGDDHV